MLNKIKFSISLTLCLLLIGCTNLKINKSNQTIPSPKNSNGYIGKKCRFKQNTHPTGHPFFVFDPNKHAWGAYSKKGHLIGCGRASGGAEWNKKLNRPSLTPYGHFKIKKIGDKNCISHRYPKPHGGALMPYCMFFLTNYAIHGAPAELIPDNKNITHGCIRISIDAAKWLHQHFLKLGTTVKTMPYKNQKNQLIIRR